MVKCLQGDVKTPCNGSHKQSVESVDAEYCLMRISEQEKGIHKRKGNSGAATLPCHAGQISTDISRYCQMTCLHMSANIRQQKIYIKTYLDRDGKENIDMEKYEYQTDVGQLKEKHLTSDLAPNPIPTAASVTTCHQLAFCIHFCPGTSISVLQASTNSPAALQP